MEIKGVIKTSEEELVNESKPRGITGKYRHISFGTSFDEKTPESEKAQTPEFENEGIELD